MRDHKPRVQKSQEYKQVIGLMVLVLAVASISFALGVAVGRRSTASLAADPGGGEVRKQVAESEKPKARDDAPAEEAPQVNLTFYDTLPKGEETPLGSGINPPPEKTAPPQTGREGTESAVRKESQASAVSTKGVERSPEPEKTKPPAVTSGEYVVQVASFQREDDARTLQTKLLSKGHRAFLQKVDLAEKGAWTRVYVGFYNSAEAAKRVADRLVAEDKLSPIVRRR